MREVVRGSLEVMRVTIRADHETAVGVCPEFAGLACRE
jgi:hypothetical protein